MKRGGRLPRRTRLRAKGGAMFPGRRDDAYRDHVRGMACVLHWTQARLPPNRLRFVGSRAVACFGGTEPHHVDKKGHGRADHANLVPLCAGHHEQQECVGDDTFEALYGVDLAATARRIWEEYQAEQGRRGAPLPF